MSSLEKMGEPTDGRQVSIPVSFGEGKIMRKQRMLLLLALFAGIWSSVGWADGAFPTPPRNPVSGTKLGNEGTENWYEECFSEGPCSGEELGEIFEEDLAEAAEAVEVVVILVP